MNLSLSLSRTSSALKQGGAGLAQAYLDRMTGAEFGFSDLTRLLTTSTGPINVATADDPVGLIIGREKQAGKTLAQSMAGQPELRASGAAAVAESAAAATNALILKMAKRSGK